MVDESPDSWLLMREAYSRYVKGVQKPVAFDSFRRLVAQRKVNSRKVTHYKEISEHALEAYVRVISRPLVQRIMEVLNENMPDEGPMFVWTDKHSLINEPTGTVPEGYVWTGDERDWDVFMEVTEKMPKDPKGYLYQDGDRVFCVVWRFPILVITLASMQDAAQEIALKFHEVTIGWLLDWLVSRGLARARLVDGTWYYSKDISSDELWNQLKTHGLV